MSGRLPILVVAPLREELDGVVGRLEGAKRARVAGHVVRQGTLAGVPVLTAVTGDGGGRAQVVVQDLLTATATRGVLGIGLSGALDPTLAWGSVLASGAVEAQGVLQPPPDAAWLAHAERSGLVLATFAVTGRIVPSAEAKARLWQDLEQRAACVDLESAAFARAASQAAVPYLVLRVVVDEAGEDVASSIVMAEDESGHVSKARVIALALRHPSEIGRLRQVARRVEVCAERLADAVEGLLRAIPA